MLEWEIMVLRIGDFKIEKFLNKFTNACMGDYGFKNWRF